MANLGQRYVGGVHWLIRAALGSAVMALVIGAIIGALLHRPAFWKIDATVYAVLMGIEIVFRLAQSKN